jgi:hypothetical protein
MFKRWLAWIDSPRGSVVTGALASVALTLFSVATGALVFGSYGWVLFMVAPFFIGLAAGYLLNRRIDIGGWRNALAVCGLMILCGIALVAAALEGAICLLMAAPLEVPLAIFGGQLGRTWARAKHGPASHAFIGFAVLPLFFAVEDLVIGPTTFPMHSSVEIQATAAQAWRAIVDMGEIGEPAPLLFRLGMSYPVAASLSGEGVGALRVGHFSTGTALEEITVWKPEREVSFKVLSEPAAMHELSPYENVYAPHVHGYFTTRKVSFRLEPLPNGGTRVALESEHTLKLEPRPYWMPLARLVIAENDNRVLRHLKQKAERYVSEMRP